MPLVQATLILNLFPVVILNSKIVYFFKQHKLLKIKLRQIYLIGRIYEQNEKEL